MLIKRHSLYGLLAAGLLFFIQSAWAKEADSKHKPWNKFNVDAAYLIASVDTELNLGAKGLGVKVDVEDFFGMDTTNSIFKINYPPSERVVLG
jgi:hypothetical protein